MDFDRRSILRSIGKGTAATAALASASGSASAEEHSALETTLADIESRFEDVAELREELAPVESSFETVGSVTEVLRREADETLAIVTDNFDDVGVGAESLLADDGTRELSSRDDIAVNAILGDRRLYGTTEGVPTAMVHLSREFAEHTVDLYVSTEEGASYAFVEGAEERYVVAPAAESQPISTLNCRYDNYCDMLADPCDVNACNVHGVQELFPYRTVECCDFSSDCFYVDETCSTECVDCVDPIGCYACTP